MFPQCSALMLSLLTTVAAPKITSPSQYDQCSYYYQTDMMGCALKGKKMVFWFMDSKIAEPGRRANTFRRNAIARCWTILPGEGDPNTVTFTPSDCEGD